MSLETEVAAFTSKATALLDYYAAFKNTAAKSIADAVAAAPAISRTFYVNQLIGDDNAAGSSTAPFKTIDRAITSTPDGGLADIVLVEDYALATIIAVGRRRVMIRGDVSTTNTRKLLLNEFAADGNTKRFGGFQVLLASSLDFADLTVSLPDSVGGMAGAPGSFYAMIFAGGNRLPGFMQVKFYNTVFTLRGTFTGKIVGSGFPCLTLTITNSTVPAALEGSLVMGVEAGKDPNTIPWLVTNVTKL